MALFDDDSPLALEDPEQGGGPGQGDDPVSAYLKKYGGPKPAAASSSSSAPAPTDPVASYLAKYGPKQPTPAAAAPVVAPPAPKPVDQAALATQQREVAGPLARRDVTQTPQTSDATPIAQRTQFPEPVRSILQYGVDPMLEQPLTTAVMGASGVPGAVIGAGSMLYRVGKYGVQAARESQMSPEELARAFQDPNRISGKEAAVDLGMLGLPIALHAGSEMLGRAFDVSGGMTEAGAHALAPLTESNAPKVVNLERAAPPIVAPPIAPVPEITAPAAAAPPTELPPEAAAYVAKYKPPVETETPKPPVERAETPPAPAPPVEESHTAAPPAPAGEQLPPEAKAYVDTYKPAATTPPAPTYGFRDLIGKSADEIEQIARDETARDKNIVVDTFGPEGAKRYNAAQRTANSAYAALDPKRADAASATIAEMEGALTDEQRNRLFGIGETGYNAEELQGAARWAREYAPENLTDMPDAELQNTVGRELTTGSPDKHIESALRLRGAAQELARRSGKSLEQIITDGVNERVQRGELSGEGQANELLSSRLNALREAGLFNESTEPAAPAPKQLPPPTPEAPPEPPAMTEEEARAQAYGPTGKVVDHDGVERFVASRTPAGARRPVERVSTDGLIAELADLEPKRLDAEQRSQYRYTVDENFHSTEDGRTVVAATRKGAGRATDQAKALQNLRDYSRILDQVHAELEKRGLDAGDIYERVTERLAEREGMRTDEERGNKYDHEEAVRDESGKVLFSPAHEGEDLFGNRPTDKDVGTGAQESLFGGNAGTEAARNLEETTRAARSELEKLKTIAPKLTDPAARQRAAARIATLEKLTNRDRAITSDELATRAAAETPPEESPATTDEPDQGALFSPAAPGTPLGRRIRTTLGLGGSADAAAKVKSLATISRTLANMVDVPLRQGRFLAKARMARGVFYPEAEVTRVVRFDQLDTAAHEVAHYLSLEYLGNPTRSAKYNKGLVSLTPTMKQELVAMGRALYGDRKPAAGYGEEGIAEWGKYFVIDPAHLERVAPEFSKFMRETILPKEPAIKAAMEQAARDFASYKAAPATARFDAMLSVKPQNRFVGTLAALRKLPTAMLDDLHEIRKAVEQLGKPSTPDKDAYVLARLVKGSAGQAEEWIERGITNAQGDRITRGFAEVLRELKPEDLQPFRRYLAAERTLELAARGIDSGFGRADAAAILKLTGDKYRTQAEELWKISNALLDYRVEKGLLTAEDAKLIKKGNTKRVGFYRVFSDEETAGSKGSGRGFGRNSSGLQAIRGSAREVIDPLESMVTDHYKTVKQARSAEVMKALVEHAQNTQGGGRVVEVLDEVPKQRVRIPVSTVAAQLEELGFEAPEGGIGPQMQHMLESFQDATTAGPREAKDLVRPIVIGDKRLWVQIKDAPLYDALNGLDPAQIPAWARVVGMPTRLLRAGSTLTLSFIGRNPVRDAWTAAIRSEAGFRPPGWDFARGMFHVMQQDEVYQRWRLAGADNAAMQGLDRRQVQKHLADIMRSPGARAAGWVLHPIDRLRMLSSLMENATRVGEYAGVERKIRRERSTTRAAASTEAAFAARNVTVDFARAGNLVRAVNQLVAFFNANVQGTANMLSDFKTRPQVVLPRIAATITVPSIALYLAQRDDPAYQEVPAWQKAVAWIIVQRDHQTGQVTHIWRIPKPQEFGILFGTVPERILDWVHTHDPHGLDKLTQSFNALSPVHWPDAATPLVEWWANKSTFTGRPVVPEGAKALPAGEQSTSRTGEAARTVGSMLHLSPAKLENAVRSTAGGLGQYGMDAANIGVRKARELEGKTPLPTPAQRGQGSTLADNPLTTGFAVREPALDAQSVQDALDSFNENEAHRQAWRHRLEAGDRAGADEYFREHEDAIRSVATPADRLGGKAGALRTAHDLIVDAQRLSTTQNDVDARAAADMAIEAARQALAGEPLTRRESHQLRAPLRQRAAEAKRNLRTP